MLAEWLGRNAYSSAEAANVLGCPVVTFRGWLAGRSEPDYFTRCAVERQMREGHDPLTRCPHEPGRVRQGAQGMAREAPFHAAAGGCGHWQQSGDSARVGVAGRRSPAACAW